jgi:hypothetical protein
MNGRCVVELVENFGCFETLMDARRVRTAQAVAGKAGYGGAVASRVND